MITNNGILYIEPSAKTSVQPVIDDITRKMTAAYRKSIEGTAYRGFHVCSCGVCRDNCKPPQQKSLKTYYWGFCLYLNYIFANNSFHVVPSGEQNKNSDLKDRYFYSMRRYNRFTIQSRKHFPYKQVPFSDQRLHRFSHK
jgi:hypothetical protein